MKIKFLKQIDIKQLAYNLLQNSFNSRGLYANLYSIHAMDKPVKHATISTYLFHHPLGTPKSFFQNNMYTYSSKQISNTGSKLKLLPYRQRRKQFFYPVLIEKTLKFEPLRNLFLSCLGYFQLAATFPWIIYFLKSKEC